MNIEVVIVSGNKMQDEFMHAADVFEPGKKLGESFTLKVTGKNIGISILTHNLKVALESEKQNVWFIALSKVAGRTPKKKYEIITPGIQTISNGNNWCLFKDVLAKIGFEVETDERMHVTKLKTK